MTTAKVKIFVFYIIYAIFCLCLLLIQSTGIATLQIGTASTLLMLPASVLAGYYFKEFAGALFGFISGILLDVYSSTTYFNTIALAICAFVCGLIMSRLFNGNITAVCVLNACASIIYFFVKWVVLYAFTDPEPMYILLNFSLPSAIYTAVCGVIMYFLLNPIFKRMPVKRRH
jgi:rod shape-determining protein MreD